MPIFDKVLREPTRAEQVMLVTHREVIEGALFHNENLRLSDALNAETQQHSRYICLKDASIYSVNTGKLIFQTAFILISHENIIYMTPKDCVIMGGATAPKPDPNGESAGIAKVASETSIPSVVEASQEFHPVAVATVPPPPQAAFICHEGHLISREDMLETLAAIRAGKTGAGGKTENGKG